MRSGLLLREVLCFENIILKIWPMCACVYSFVDNTATAMSWIKDKD